MYYEMTLDKLEELVGALDENGIDYSIFAGFGLDGIRGELSRPHQDVDMMVLREDYEEIKEVLGNLGYEGEVSDGLYKLKRNDGAKAHLEMVTVKGDEIVLTGPKKITRIPLEIFENTREIEIEGVAFRISSNEILRFWGSFDRTGHDREYSQSLPFNADLYDRITREERF